MATIAMVMTATRLADEGYTPVHLPTTIETPIPGLWLFVKPDQHELLRVNPDGTTTDLLKLESEIEALVEQEHGVSK